MRRGVRSGRTRPFMAWVAIVCAVVLVGVGGEPASAARTAGAATSGGSAAASNVDLSACSHRITHRKHLTRQQLRLRKQRWARLCRQAQAAAAQQAAAQQAAAQQAAAQASAEAAAQAAAQQAAAQAAAEQAAREAAYRTAVAPTPAPSEPCGATTYLKADGTPYACAFSDEFSGSSLDTSKWSTVRTAVTGQRAGVECDIDSPDTIGVGGDVLTVTARRLSTPMTCDSPYGAFDTSYTGGMITTSRKYAQAYGRFEMRARFPQSTVAGLQSSLWMYPQDNTYGAWPKSGEIDIAEWFSGWGTLAVPHLHYGGDANDPSRGSYACQLGDPTAFHTFAVEWTPVSITFVYDGQTCLRNSTWTTFTGLLGGAPFDQPFNLLIGNGRGDGKNAPTADTPFPSALQVDYVRAWS